MHSDDKCLLDKYYSQLYTYTIIHLYYMVLKKVKRKNATRLYIKAFILKFIFLSSDQSFLACPKGLTVDAPLH